jgi:hypothetical protein
VIHIPTNDLPKRISARKGRRKCIRGNNQTKHKEHKNNKQKSKKIKKTIQGLI